MKATKIRLRFTAPLHIAARGVGFERVGWIIHSDTLYSAILTTWSAIAPDEVEQLVQAEPPPFLLSSAFPYQGKAEFYPKPLAPPLEVALEHRKALAKVQFVETAVFQKIVKGEPVPFSSNSTKQGGRFWIGPASPSQNQAPEAAAKENKSKSKRKPPAPDDPIIYETEVPRVAIDRVTNAGTLYFVSELRFGEDAGLFFWMQFDSDEIRDRFIQVLRVLGDEGLGLDRTSGKGLFEVHQDDIKHGQTLPGSDTASRFLTLSVYYPSAGEIAKGLLRPSSYELVQRGGYVFGHSYRRRTLTMFTEGSIFNSAPSASYGGKSKVLDKDSTLLHDIYRYGYAFPIGFHSGATL